MSEAWGRIPCSSVYEIGIDMDKVYDFRYKWYSVVMKIDIDITTLGMYKENSVYIPGLPYKSI